VGALARDSTAGAPNIPADIIYCPILAHKTVKAALKIFYSCKMRKHWNRSGNKIENVGTVNMVK